MSEWHHVDMQLPNADRAIVDEKKIVEYLLSPSHPDGREKAKFFAAFGFSLHHWRVLASALGQQCRRHPVAKAVESPHGIRYSVDGSIETPSGKKPTIRTVWIVESGRETPRLITAHPL